MTTPDIQQAREWAEIVSGLEGIAPRPRAAAEVIQSLPDHWIDAKKVAELADDMANWSLPDVLGTNENDFRHLIEIMGSFADRISDLLTPPLPTFEDMTAEDREACQWMQAQVFATFSTPGIITNIDEYARSAIILFTDGMAKNVPWKEITPLPGPKLEWPGRHADTITAESVEDAPIVDDEPIMMPRPEDVKQGDCWLVKFDGHEWVGTRDSRAETVCSWVLARLDGADYTVSRDDEITLISRMVLEREETA